MSEHFNREEFFAGYLVEAEEHLHASSKNLLYIEGALERNENCLRQIRELFRSLHTLKGLSAMVGIEPIVHIAHEMETVLRLANQGATAMTAPGVALLLDGVRAIEQRVRSFAKRQPVAPAPRKLLEALARLSQPTGSVSLAHAATLDLAPELLAKLTPAEQEQLAQGIKAGQSAYRVDFVPSPERSAQGLSITSVRERVTHSAEIVKVVPQTRPKSEQAPGGLAFALILLTRSPPGEVAAAASAEPEELQPIALLVPDAEPEAPVFADELHADDDSALEAAPTHSTIRIDTARLDDALDRLGAIVVTRFKLARALNKLREQGVDVREIQSVLQDHGREIRHLRTAITRARMISVSQLLERVPLIVRSMGSESAKKVRLVIEAGQSELDKAVADRIFPALVHLVRNAVDHAIEAPEERERRGKPAQGTITVSCHEHSNTQLELVVRDDGRGIDPAAIAQKAQRPTPVDAVGLLELVTRPGLSTSDQVTERSGRGMGMDIVRRIAVDTLGGELSLETELHVGTTFRLRIPLSISILDGLTFECGAQAFVTPLSMVEEIVELQAEEVFNTPGAAQTASGAKLLSRRGSTLPLFDLADVFRMQRSAGPAAVGLRSAIVVKRQGERFAFSVDRMLGQQEVVVRPLEDPLVKMAFVAGTTDLGDGRPTLVLDLSSLSQSAVLSGKQVVA